jgi:TolB-like protein/class 3 adenylate cyclase/Flp pilus assembly protein TadD/rhodanese-related sulfurtransferase
MERRLAAILTADVVGYSRLMGEDEAGTVARLEGLTAEILGPLIEQHSGRIVKLMGDGFLVEFGSVVDSLECAVSWQKAVEARAEQTSEDRAIRFRIGVNIGDVIVKGDDVYGDGVNVAARLEGLAQPGEVLVSRTVADHVKGKIGSGFEDLGERELKNISEPVQVYRVVAQTGAPTTTTAARKKTGLPKVPLIAAGLAVLILAAGAVLWLKPWAPRIEAASVERMALPLPDKPSVAVLPFDNMSGDAEQDYFSDGMTEDLITDLSKNPELFVIARNSSFAYKGQKVKVHQVAEELGVRYVLEGSVRRAGDQVRINAQLIDATTGGHLWAERYDGTIADVFELQDKVTRQIVAALAVSLGTTEELETPQAETESPEAYDVFLQGWDYYRRGTPEDFSAAIPFFERALQLDPNYGRANSALAAVYWNSMWSGWNWKMGLPQLQASTLAQKYLRAARESPLKHSALTYQVASEYSSQFRRKADRALAHAERAIALDANNPAGYLAMANALLKAGRPDEATENVKTAMRLDPHFPASYLTRLGRAQFSKGRFEEAAETFEKAVNRNPDDDWNFVYLAATYGQLGRDDKANAAVTEANGIRARLGWDALTLGALGQWVFRWTGDQKSFREGLVKAGVGGGQVDWMALVISKGDAGWYDVDGATTIDVETAKAMHNRGVPFVTVDSRWIAEHIPGAYSMELDTGEFNNVRLSEIVNKDREVVIYRGGGVVGGRDRDAANASAMAVNWGFEKVYYFADGMDAWRNAGYPVEKP